MCIHITKSKPICTSYSDFHNNIFFKNNLVIDIYYLDGGNSRDRLIFDILSYELPSKQEVDKNY